MDRGGSADQEREAVSDDEGSGGPVLRGFARVGGRVGGWFRVASAVVQGEEGWGKNQLADVEGELRGWWVWVW